MTCMRTLRYAHHRTNLLGYVPFHSVVGWSITVFWNSLDSEVARSQKTNLLYREFTKLGSPRALEGCVAKSTRLCINLTFISGLLCWTKAMAFFFGVNKEVLPLKINLAFQEARLKSANNDLHRAQVTLVQKEEELAHVKKLYCSAVKVSFNILQWNAEFRNVQSPNYAEYRMPSCLKFGRINRHFIPNASTTYFCICL